MRVRLFDVESETRRLLKTFSTNGGGRADEPLMAGDRIPTGIYELEFGVGGYFGVFGGEPPFLGDVVVRFGVSGTGGNYRVPLPVAPYGYSTYRGA